MNEKVNIILIGGPARVGKTTLVSRILKKLPYYALSTDNLKYMGQKFNVMQDLSSSEDWHIPNIWLEKIRKRDKEIWQWTKEYIISSIKSNKSLIVEGNLWIDYINNDLEFFKDANVLSIFIIDTSSLDNSSKKLVNLKKTDPYNWLNTYSDNMIFEFAQCNKLRSEYMKKLANENNSLVYDIKDYNSLDEMQNEIEKEIFNRLV